VIELRTATPRDAPALAELFRARWTADFGESDVTADEVGSWWLGEGRAENRLAFLDGRVAGYARFYPEGDVIEANDESCTHPEVEGRGVATALLDEVEQAGRARGLARARATAVNDAGRALLTGRGYQLVRHFWRMEIDFDSAPYAELPPGYRFAPYREGADDVAVHACHQAAFAEHWGFVPDALDEWLRRRHGREDYDPRGWVLAWASDELAGGSLAFPWKGKAWVLDVFVARADRGCGLGLALLRETFTRVHELGCRHAGLEVDAANETGATRLYERAGMHVTRRYDTYEKQL
jgi:mycothiol synthase